MLVKGLHEQMEGREAKREEGREEGKEGESREERQGESGQYLLGRLAESRALRQLA